MATNETEMEEPQDYDDANEEEKEEQEPKPKKEKKPDEPPPDGEGELGPPMKRVYFIGGGLGIWGICAVWLMIYWLASAVDPCRYQIRTYTCYAIYQLDACEEDGYSQCEAFYTQEDGFGGKALSSNTGSGTTTPAPTLFTINRRRRLQQWWTTPSPVSPDYITYASVVDTNAVDPDTVSNGREYFNDLYAYDYVASSWPIRMVAWLVLTFGIGLTFFGIVFSYFAVKSGKGCYKAMAYILVGLGGALTIVGGILLTASWDYERFEDLSSDLEDMNNALRATQLGEFLFVGVIGIIFAIDLQRLLLNDQEKRLMVLSIPTAILGLYLGGCYAYVMNWVIDGQPACENDRLPNRLLRNEFGCISAGYFIFAIGCILGLLVAKEKISLNPAKATLYKLIICVLIVGGGFICAVGYWAFIDKTFDYDNECFVCDGNPVCSTDFHYVDIISYFYADGVQPALFQGATSYDVKYEGQFKAFYVGLSMFVFLLTAGIAYDMEIVGNYKKVRAAQGGDSDEYAD